MFSGIVEETGCINKVRKKENLYVVTLAAKRVSRGAKIGDSIAVDGICLTVTKKDGNKLTFDLMKETLDKTTFRYAAPGRKVNLERSLKVGDRLGGHFVTGHIDGTGVFAKRIDLPNYVEWRIRVEPRLARYIIPKGSVTIDGVSLTVGEVKRDYFSVYLIPHTLEVTTFGKKRIGEIVNIETDVLAKCGEPSLKDSHVEEFRDKLDGTERNVLVTVEEWTYNLGPTRFVRILTFRNSRLTDIRTGNYGY